MCGVTMFVRRECLLTGEAVLHGTPCLDLLLLPTVCVKHGQFTTGFLGFGKVCLAYLPPRL